MEVKIYRGLPEASRMLREEVFVNEQGFFEEYGETDEEAIHIMLYDADLPVSTCRIYETDEKGVYMFGRLAVKKQLRGRGVGAMSVREAEKYVVKQGGKSIILHAQYHAREFYERLGFTAVGDVEYVQNAPHIHMKKIL